MDLVEHLHKQAAWSISTFGPGTATKGVLNHIEKEMEEIKESDDPYDRSLEWVDMVILSFDGLMRELRDAHPTMTLDMIATLAADRLKTKTLVNELRTWPDWRTQDPDKAIEHDRSKD